MFEKSVKLVFDRKKKPTKDGLVTVEIQLCVSRDCRKYISLGATRATTPEERATYTAREDVQEHLQKYVNVLEAMHMLGEEMTTANLNAHLGITPKEHLTKKETAIPFNGNFIDFMHDSIMSERIEESTRKVRIVTLDSLVEFGKIRKFQDLTAENIRAYDAWLREDGTRCDVTIAGYHKRVRHYVAEVYERGWIDRNPYNLFTYPHGHHRERKPLTEKELKKMQSLDLPSKEAKARDLFIFSAYTGLAYCDAQNFDFETMTEQMGDMYYIDGSRIKTGSNFFTPIFPPAMEVLKRYNYHLPRLSNQKMNDYLHLIESRLKLNKNLTSHIARHSFATIVLAHDVPIENVARMLGHKNIQTTQIYAKILKSTIVRHANTLKGVFK